MRGAFLHNYMVKQLEDAFWKAGAKASCEYPTRSGRHPGFVDLFIEWDFQRIVGEVELSAQRVENDVAKAQELQAQVLLIVVPSTSVATAVRREILRIQAQSAMVRPVIYVLHLGSAIQLITDKSILKSAMNVRTTTIPLISSTLPHS